MHVDTLGTVQDITHTGMVVVRGKYAPRPGTRVFDSAKKEVGKVRRVFGPVKTPYITVKPSRPKGEELLKLMGKRVFADKR